VPEAPLVVLAQRGVVAHQLVGAQHQLGEVDHAFALALRVVGFVDLDQDAALLVADLDVLGAQAVVLGGGDRPGHLLGNVALLVEVHRLHHPFHRRELVGRIEDLEALRQRRELPVGAQEPVAQAVEGADPHAAHRYRQHRVEPGQHLLRRLVGEGDGEHAAGRELAGLDQPGDAGGEDAGLAGAGAGEDQGRLGRQGDGGKLFGVRAFEEAGRGGGRGMGKHRPIVGGRPAAADRGVTASDAFSPEARIHALVVCENAHLLEALGVGLAACDGLVQQIVRPADVAQHRHAEAGHGVDAPVEIALGSALLPDARR
jgi:hypothetical protein